MEVELHYATTSYYATTSLKRKKQAEGTKQEEEILEQTTRELGTGRDICRERGTRQVQKTIHRRMQQP